MPFLALPISRKQIAASMLIYPLFDAIGCTFPSLLNSFKHRLAHVLLIHTKEKEYVLSKGRKARNMQGEIIERKNIGKKNHQELQTISAPKNQESMNQFADDTKQKKSDGNRWNQNLRKNTSLELRL